MISWDTRNLILNFLMFQFDLEKIEGDCKNWDIPQILYQPFRLAQLEWITCVDLSEIEGYFHTGHRHTERQTHKAKKLSSISNCLPTMFSQEVFSRFPCLKVSPPSTASSISISICYSQDLSGRTTKSMLALEENSSEVGDN